MRERDLILETVSIPDVLRVFAGVEGKRHRLQECPINGCTSHDCFAYTNRVFHCFTCGANGDVIGFVMAYLDCDFKTALAEINNHFRLWDISLERQREAQIRAERRRQAKRVQEYHKERKNALKDELERLTANRVKFAPKSPDDELDPRYIEALQRLPTQEYIVESDTGGGVPWDKLKKKKSSSLPPIR